MLLTLIAAMSENGFIGLNGSLPWHLRDDLQNFKTITTGHHIVFGRKTWESILRPLPQRTLIILSNTLNSIDGCLVAESLEEAMAIAEQKGETELFVGGGESVYRASLPLADRLILTNVDVVLEGDVRFPELESGSWTKYSERSYAANSHNDYPFLISEFRRRGSER